LIVHYEPVVLLLSVVFLEALSGLSVNVVLSNGSQTSAAISLGYHQIARLDSEAGLVRIPLLISQSRLPSTLCLHPPRMVLFLVQIVSSAGLGRVVYSP
jgi:hypothetical protein